MNADRRKQALQQRANALAALQDPDLPQHIRDLYKKSLDHGDVALGLADAAERKAERQQESEAPR